MKKKTVNILKICFLMIVIIIVVVLYLSFSFAKNNRVEVTLKRCVDGDTALFLLNHKEVLVRFLAIDTPESVHPEKDVEDYAIEASEYTCGKLKNAEHIYLEYDNHSKKYDKYDRLLAWVFVDNDNLNELLVQNGYAVVRYIYGSYHYLDKLCDSENWAYQQKLGIWYNDKGNIIDNYCNISN